MEQAPETVWALVALLALASVYLVAGTRLCKRAWQHGLLSVAGGISVAYVFLRLIPELGAGQARLTAELGAELPFVEKHVYLMSLVGILVFSGVDYLHALERTRHERPSHLGFWLHLGAVAALNFSVGYALMDKNDPDVQPLFLFSSAMWLHCFVLDHGLREVDEALHDRYGRWILMCTVLAGGLIGALYEIPESAVALVIAFIAGGTIMGVMRHEIPTASGEHSGRFLLFVAGCACYSAVLLVLA